MSVTSPGTADVRKQLAELRHRLKEQRDFSAELRLEAVRDPSGSATERLARSRNAEDVISAQIEDLRARESEELSALSRNGYGAVGMDGLGMDVTTRLHDPIVHADPAKIGRSVTRLGDPYRLAEIPAQDVMPWLARNLASFPTGTVTPTPGMGSVPLTTAIPLPVPEPTFLSVIPPQVSKLRPSCSRSESAWRRRHCACGARPDQAGSRLSVRRLRGDARNDRRLHEGQQAAVG